MTKVQEAAKEWAKVPVRWSMTTHEGVKDLGESTEASLGVMAAFVAGARWQCEQDDEIARSLGFEILADRFHQKQSVAEDSNPRRCIVDGCKIITNNPGGACLNCIETELENNSREKKE